MTREDWIKRIASDPGVRGGEPCVRGTRVPVSVVVGSIADGDTVDELIADYPSLSREDVQACLKYAAEAVRDVRILPLAG